MPLRPASTESISTHNRHRRSPIRQRHAGYAGRGWRVAFIPTQGGVVGRGALSRLEAAGRVSRRSSWTGRYCTHSSTRSARTSASRDSPRPCRPRARLRADPAAHARRAPRGARATARLPASRKMPTPATRPRPQAGSWARKTSPSFPSRGVSWGSGLEPPPHLVGERARALDVLAAGGPRLRLCGSGRRGAAAGRSAARDASAPGRRRAGLRGAGRAARARRLRAGRARRGARPVRRPRRSDRRLPLDRPRAAADRALRRRDRRHPRVLAVHPARAPARRRGRRSTRRPSGDST